MSEPSEIILSLLHVYFCVILAVQYDAIAITKYIFFQYRSYLSNGKSYHSNIMTFIRISGNDVCHSTFHALRSPRLLEKWNRCGAIRRNCG
jgi:hypothetical protein